MKINSSMKGIFQMKIFDLMKLEAEGYENRGVNVLTLKENQVFITEPALLSMESASGARLMGIHIKTGAVER